MTSLFPPELPSGFLYRSGFITPAEERALVAAIDAVGFETFTMRGVAARRRVRFFGESYDHHGASPMPAFLADLRVRLASWAGVQPGAFVMALINEYTRGATIGWHRDAPQYGITAGVSLLAPCRMKLRPYAPPRPADDARPVRRMATHEITLEPQSAYLITGVARDGFEHSIPPTSALRYSVTFRTRR